MITGDGHFDPPPPPDGNMEHADFGPTHIKNVMWRDTRVFDSCQLNLISKDSQKNS